MNYQKIYSDFIDDRRGRVYSECEYLEKHHILPKSLGGSDDPGNIILLTPGDHYFAHLCLAKIYGGSQWGAVWCMVKMTISKRRKRAAQVYGKRRLVNVARREFAKAKSEKLTGIKYRERQKKHTIYHNDGRTLTGPVSDLVDQTGVSFASMSRLVSGNQSSTRSGWYACSEKLSAVRNKRSEMGRRAAEKVAGKNARKVRCVDTGVIYKSITDARMKTGIHVKNAFRANRETAGGCRWEYV